MLVHLMRNTAGNAPTRQKRGAVLSILKAVFAERDPELAQYKRPLHGLVGNGTSFRNDPVLKKQCNNFRSVYWRWRAQQHLKGNRQ